MIIFVHMKTVKFHINIPIELNQLNDVFNQEHAKLYLVGGAVRDALTGNKPKDFDLVTEALPERIIEILINHNIKMVDKDFRFGVIRAYINEHEFEIVTARKDETSGRRPDSVSFTDISHDASRRDLTINALYYDISTETIIDHVGGIKDIKKNIIKTVGKTRDRFTEDPLRKLRAIRFAGIQTSQFNKNIDNALKEDNSLLEVSEERIRDEFIKTINRAQSIPYVLGLLNKYSFLSNCVLPNLNLNTASVSN